MGIIIDRRSCQAIRVMGPDAVVAKVLFDVLVDVRVHIGMRRQVVMVLRHVDLAGNILSVRLHLSHTLHLTHPHAHHQRGYVGLPAVLHL